MKPHSNHEFHDGFETSEFRQRDRRRQREYDPREWKRTGYQEEDDDADLGEPRNATIGTSEAA